MKIVLASAGKAAVLNSCSPIFADLYIDCRGMINPFRDPVLGGKTGDDPEVQDWIEEKNEDYTSAAYAQITTAVISAASRNSFKSNPDKPLTVVFFCMAGVHRSRGMKNVIGRFLKEDGYDVEVIK